MEDSHVYTKRCDGIEATLPQSEWPIYTKESGGLYAVIIDVRDE